jgi:transposase
MSGKRYTDEFKIAAVKQVTEHGHAAHEVADRLGVSIHSMYSWIKRYSVPDEERIAADAQSDEVRRLKAELKRVTDERDILKKAAVGSTSQRNSSYLMALLWGSNAKNWKTWAVCAAEKRIMGPLERSAIAV